MSPFAVITTIQEPTPAVHELHRRLEETGGRLIVAGDQKGPASWNIPDCDFLSLADQRAAGFSLADGLPTNHYARKNIGYLHAIRAGAECIYETDDDNAPLATWTPRTEKVSKVRKIEPFSEYQPSKISEFSPQWVNAYRYFSKDWNIWPRGFPLDRLSENPPVAEKSDDVISPIQQGLVNGSPDVDAVWRLTQDRPFEFDANDSLWLAPGQWCPFNTQSTWWWPAAYPLLYVPSHCSFRMCDIWKSFIAQRCLWAMGAGVVFHAPEVIQERNEHNLMKDFEDEIPGYMNNNRIAEVLDGLKLSGNPAEDVLTCYRALVREGVFPKEELQLIDSWLTDLEGCGC